MFMFSCRVSFCSLAVFVRYRFAGLSPELNCVSFLNIFLQSLLTFMKGGRSVSVYILDWCHSRGGGSLLLPFRSYDEERLGNGVVSAYVCLYRQISSVPCSDVWLFFCPVRTGIF